MMLPQDNDRSWNRFVWKYFHRLGRCVARASRESGFQDAVFLDALVYGTGIYTPEQQAIDAERCQQLMLGLKPKQPKDTE